MYLLDRQYHYFFLDFTLSVTLFIYASVS